MSQGLFKVIGGLNNFLKSQSWLTAPIYWMVNRAVPTETRDNLAWSEEADLAILEQAPLKAKKLLHCMLAILIAALVFAQCRYGPGFIDFNQWRTNLNQITFFD